MRIRFAGSAGAIPNSLFKIDSSRFSAYLGCLFICFPLSFRADARAPNEKPLESAEEVENRETVNQIE